MEETSQVFDPGRGPGPLSDHELRAAFAALARTSGRVRHREYGVTAGGRPLFALTISNPANLARLPEIERGLRVLESARETEVSRLIADLPATVWIGCGIHGDEISGPDAALALARRLATATDSETLGWLDALVIHIDPLVNPEGRERLLAHTRAYSRRRGPVDPQDIFHNAFWPEGRGNHYLFDLNRDAVFTVQPESRARVAAVTAAMPQLYVDIHEMAADDTYLFAVPAEPLNPHLPAAVHESWRDVGADHAAEFDRDGTSYYTRAWNEVFYPGFFDVWPAYHGAVPILYEQSATNGGSVRLPNGRVRTWQEAIESQLRSARANLSTAARMKGELLARWRHARQPPAGARRTWIVASDDRGKLREVERVLRAQGIQLSKLAAALEIDGLRDAWDEEPKRVRLGAGSLSVSTAQPLGRLVANLFDFHVPCAREFLERERRGLDLGGRTALFDVTAWSLPFAFGLDAWWTQGEVAGEWRSIDEPSAPPRAVKSTVAPLRARYGHLLRDPSLHAAARLLARGVRLRVTREELRLGNQTFAPGTLLLRGDDQTADFHAALEEEIARGDALVVPVDSARVLEGPDLGGRDFPLLRAPGIGLLTGAGFSAPGTGALWYLFDAAIGIDATLLDFARLESLDLSTYDVLLLPEALDAAWCARELAGVHGARLRSWMDNGGTLVALGKSSQALAAAGFGSALLRSASLDRYPPALLGCASRGALDGDFATATGFDESPKPAEVTRPVIGRGALAFAGDAPSFSFPGQVDSPAACSPLPGARLQRYLPRGAYLATDLHPAHWLRYGAGGESRPDRLAVICRESDALLAAAPSLDIVARYAAPRELALSGLVWPEAVGYLAGTAYLTREKLGAGQLIAFSGDPVFRGYSLGTQRLLLNAVVFGPGFRRL